MPSSIFWIFSPQADFLPNNLQGKLDFYKLMKKKLDFRTSNAHAVPLSEDYGDLFLMGPKEIFDLQKVHQQKVADLNYRQRKERVGRILAATQDYDLEVKEAMAKDFSKASWETSLLELLPIAHEAKYTMRHLKRWMKPKKVSNPMALLGSQSYIRYEPKGVVLIIAPWNYPINLTFGPLISALAAGNTVIIKPSEMTPNTSALMSKIIKKIFPPEEVYLFEGGLQIAQELLKLPFNHIFFTGSPQVGKLVMKAASDNLASVTLELGGKSPTIVDDTANLELASTKIAWSKFMNNGQTCIAPDYVYVHEDVKEELIQKIQKKVDLFYGDTSEKKKKSRDYCRIVNKKHFQRLEGLLDDAEKNRGVIRFGGVLDSTERYIEPTLVTDFTKSARIMKEEIFGPILPVCGYSSLEDTIQYIFQQEKPLALYVFSKNKNNINKIISNTRAGGGCINDCTTHYLHSGLPFGGSNNSGIGKSHGWFGFENFSNARSIVRQRTSFSMTQLLLPPFNKLKNQLVSITLRYF